jgi:hypothetical protein
LTIKANNESKGLQFIFKNNNQVSTVIEINEQERQKILLLELQVANLKEITYL